MPFTAPDLAGASVPLTGFQLIQKRQQQMFENALEAAKGSRGGGGGGDLLAGQDREDALAAQTDRFKAELAMTPGVNGPETPAGYNLLDAPALQPQHFSVGGADYSFDPGAAATAKGVGSALTEDSHDSTRFQALQQVPGIDARTAARLVYGRSGVLDNPDPLATDAALAEYTRNPNAQTAAAAVAQGAKLNNFSYLDQLQPDPANPSGNFVPRPLAPVPGTPAYYDMQQKLEDMRIAGGIKEINQRAAVAPSKTDTATQQLARRKFILTQIGTLSGGDEGKAFDAIASDPKMNDEVTKLNIPDAEIRAAAQQFRTTQANKDAGRATSVFTAGMAATPEDAQNVVARLKGNTPAGTTGAPNVQQQSWDRAMKAIQAKIDAKQALSPVEQQFLKDHPNRPQ